MKQFISVGDVPSITGLAEAALACKANPLKDQGLGQGKRIGLIFFNPSLRTRLSTQIAARNLGMESIVFNAGGEGWALEFADGAVMNGTTVEHIRDAAPVMGAYFDMLCIRAFPSLLSREKDDEEQVLQQFIRYAGVPVISLESATLHPLQSLADVITITEQWQQSRKPKVVLTWAPHVKPVPQCVANSFAQWMNAWEDVTLTITHPEGYGLNTAFTNGADITHNQEEALADADFVYVKSWSSYEAYGQMPDVVGDWMLTASRLHRAPAAKMMHCLPVRRNVELSDTILDGSRSLVQAQAANRVWSAQAVLGTILKNL